MQQVWAGAMQDNQTIQLQEEKFFSPFRFLPKTS